MVVRSLVYNMKKLWKNGSSLLKLVTRKICVIWLLLAILILRPVEVSSISVFNFKISFPYLGYAKLSLVLPSEVILLAARLALYFKI